ncbi:MAG: hypothetical protein ABFC94_04655 [Syntrophomonas sp.]
MANINRSLLVIIVFILVVLGLNTSNEGIGSLTMENRKPVLDINRDHDTVNVVLLGDNLNLERDELSNNVTLRKTYDVARDGYSYLHRIWRIFYAVFIF